jgi:hypothetical protein
LYSCERCSTQLLCIVVAQRPPPSGRLSSRRPYFFSSASPGIGLFHLTRSSVGCIVAGNPSPDMARKRTDSGGSNRGPPDGPFPSLPQAHYKASPGVSLPQLVWGTISNVNLSRAQLGRVDTDDRARKYYLCWPTKTDSYQNKRQQQVLSRDRPRECQERPSQQITTSFAVGRRQRSAVHVQHHIEWRPATPRLAPQTKHHNTAPRVRARTSHPRPAPIPRAELQRLAIARPNFSGSTTEAGQYLMSLRTLTRDNGNSLARLRSDSLYSIWLCNFKLDVSEMPVAASAALGASSSDPAPDATSQSATECVRGVSSELTRARRCGLLEWGFSSTSHGRETAAFVPSSFPTQSTPIRSHVACQTERGWTDGSSGRRRRRTR